jgi:hypothetical protein
MRDTEQRFAELGTPKPLLRFVHLSSKAPGHADTCHQAKAEASAELEQAARSTSVGRTVERGPVVSALIERLERRADTEGRRS